jgi:hypothetical protein
VLSVPLILAYPGIATLHGWVLWVILNLASIVKTFFSVRCCTPLSCFERATQFAQSISTQNFILFFWQTYVDYNFAYRHQQCDQWLETMAIVCRVA